jgi:hypothetical protein
VRRCSGNPGTGRRSSAPTSSPDPSEHERYRKRQCLSITIVLDHTVARRCRVSIRRLLALQEGLFLEGRRRRHTRACEAYPDCRQCWHRYIFFQSPACS